MKISRITCLIGAPVVALLVGCQTTYTKKVHNEAGARFHLVRAQMAFDQAEQAFATGQFDKAMKQIDSAIAVYDESTDYHLLKGRIYLETNRLEKAMASLDRATEIDPQSDQPHYFRGIVLQRWSDFEGALMAYQEAYELDRSKVQYLLATAEVSIARGEFAAARELIEPRMDYFEHNAALRQLLGQVALLQSDPDRAATLFNEAHMLAPDDDMLLEDLARARFASGEYAKAYHHVKDLQDRIREPRPDLMQLEARCLTMTDRVKEARNLYLKLSQDNPAEPTVWIELGNVAFEVGDFRRVSMCADRSIALAPDRFEGYLLRGLHEQHLGHDAEAIQNFRTATTLAPDVAWPALLLGMTLEQQGQTAEALLAYGAALRVQPDNAQARSLFEGVGGTLAIEARDQRP